LDFYKVIGRPTALYQTNSNLMNFKCPLFIGDLILKKQLYSTAINNLSMRHYVKPEATWLTADAQKKFTSSIQLSGKA
jgi:hypothetical protein